MVSAALLHMAALAMDVRTALGRLRVRAHRNHGQKLYDGLSLTGEPVILPPAFAQPRPRAKPGNQPPTLRRLTDTVRGVIAHVGAVNQLSFGALRKGLGAAMGSHLEGSLPFVARHAPTNVPLKQARDFATASLPLEEMHRIGHQFGATLNDVAATIIDHGLLGSRAALSRPARPGFPQRGKPPGPRADPVRGRRN